MNNREREHCIAIIKKKYNALEDSLNEKTRRLWAATEAQAIGEGGISIVSEAIAISRDRIYRGIADIAKPEKSAGRERVRRPGGGRKNVTEHDVDLTDGLTSIIEPHERGNPMSPLRWTTKSLEKLACALQELGHTVGRMTVGKLLKQQGYSLQANRKMREGTNHPDRNAQFEYINDSVAQQQKLNEPCISVDTKKKENVGNYKNNGQEWSKKGVPVEVNMHDFPNKELGKAAPYGVYDLIKNEGWVNVGISSDTAAFAVESIRRWWKHMGSKRYPTATELLITADSGGSNSARNRLWKVELQKLANELNMTIRVRHFPPGTSKWNKIEHRLFSMISKNWRGKPLDSLATIIDLIGNTTTKTGLTVKAMLDENVYEKGIKIPDNIFNSLNIVRDDFHGEWNYALMPKR
jgi:hypothetical protein